MKKKWMIILVSFLVLAGAGAWYVKRVVSEKIYSEISRYISSPEVQQALQQESLELLADPSNEKMISDWLKNNSDNGMETGKNPTTPNETAPPRDANQQQGEKGSYTPSDGQALNNGSPTSGSPAKSAEASQSESSKGSKGDDAGKAPATSPPSSTGSGKSATQFKNQDEAMRYALKKFNAQEIVQYTSIYKDRNSLTPERKEQIKKDVLSRFTADEIRALMAAAK